MSKPCDRLRSVAFYVQHEMSRDMAKEAEAVATDLQFSKVFSARLDNIERRALQLGTSLTAICKGIGISRATPDRWRRQIPRTIEIVDAMEKWTEEYASKKARAATGLTEA